MSLLELHDVSKTYGQGPTEVQALSDVALSVDAGELVAVMGASGSGKSTLLTIAGSLEEPTSGEVLLDGATLSRMSRNDQARLRRRFIGYVFQDYNLLAGLTALENVALPLELDGVSSRKAQSAGLAALEQLGLSDRAPRFPDELSGGERQRVAIARAIVGDRHLLLADEPSGQVTVLFDATGARVAGFTFPQGAIAETPQHPAGISPAIVVLVVSALGLIFIGLVVAASFAVLAQRRLRSLGMLSSLGATDGNVRLVMVANGAVVGITGALMGAVIGLAAWIAYVPRLSVSAHHRVAWTSLPWWMIAAALVLAVVTAVLASLRPARAVAHTSVVAALSGRPAPPRARHRSALPGIGLLVVGLILLAFSGGLGATGGKPVLFTLGSIIAVAAGLLLLAPVAITALAVIARRPPISTRIALRDLIRYRTRSSSALAATSFAVLIAVLIVLLATGRFADAVDYVGPNLPSNQLIVYVPSLGPASGGGGPGPATTGSRQSIAALQGRASEIAASLGSHDVLALEVSGALLQEGSRQGDSANPLVATPALLRHYGIDPGAIDPTTLLITSRPGLQRASDLKLLVSAGNANQSGPPDFLGINPKIQTFGNLPTYTSDPNLLVTAYAVHKLGLQTTPLGWLIQTPKPLNALQVNSARQAAAATGMTIETKNSQPSLAQLRTYATVAGIILALGVLAMTVGLIRGETAGELRTLTANGASSRVRRSLTGVTAGSIALLGALLGTAVAYLATVAFFHSQLSDRMSHAPVLDLLLILVGLPVVATVGGWLFAGHEPPAIGRQPIE